ncbi:DUF5700 domain-containing putative Zn-dependent protease [Pedobacter gandavensis]|uniref:DUF2268 domain-containing protein n=1 Tax=Pedobacter gandavensis TaxID=2679963 RepID=A0ABR6ETP9_9SPHI|nr:DUF5700 domain-containing putative Zn-dependent protease [Pedobacter gandavensis]MBB2148640.1 hypothetical protein [Pedobacter gandavensis]
MLITLSYFSSASPIYSYSRHKITMDYSAAEELIRLVGLKSVSDEELSRFASLYGNKLLIQKTSNSTGGTEQVFKKTLKEMITTGKVNGDDPYQWGKVSMELQHTKKLIAGLKLNKDSFTVEILERISAYTPAILPPQELRAYLLLGGTATGFVSGDEGAFCVALQNFGSDFEGLKTIMVHELYHAVQQAGQNSRKKMLADKPTYNTKATYFLIYNLWSEGTAESLGDFGLIKNPGRYSKIQQENQRKNEERLLVNFKLIEMMLYKMYTDSNARYAAVYNIGFSPVYEEAAYSVGAEMARKLDRLLGKEVLAEMVVQDPLDFISSYIKLYQDQPKEVPYQFDKSTEAIVEKLLAWRNRI